MYNEKKISVIADRDKILDLFQDRNRQLRDQITVTAKEDIDHFLMALWGAWKMLENGSVSAEDLGNLVIQYQGLSYKLSKVLSLAKLSQYATGFEIPEDTDFTSFTIKDLTNTKEEN